MTFDRDPARWTSSPEEAPELLRGAFRAARDEGPSRGQMRSLAIKLAAASAGGAVAVGTVKAASAGHTLATAASWSAGKIAAVVAIAGTLVTGGAVVWQAGSQPQPSATVGVASAPAVSATQAPEPSGEPAPGSAREKTSLALEPGTPRVAPVEGTPIVEKLSAAEVESPAQRAAAASERKGAAKHEAGPAAKAVNVSLAREPARFAPPTKAARAAASEKPARAQQPQQAGQAARTPEAQAQASEKPSAPPSELELLRRAQVALSGRPREAFQLTQEHRKLYPAGEFSQERDALAIQALMRTGDEDKARDLAATFVRSYPSSPHAHRFREAMGLR